MNSAGTDFKKFTVEEIVARMPEQYRGVLKKNLKLSNEFAEISVK